MRIDWNKEGKCNICQMGVTGRGDLNGRELNGLAGKESVLLQCISHRKVDIFSEHPDVPTGAGSAEKSRIRQTRMSLESKGSLTACICHVPK